METSSTATLELEWVTLQNQYDSYEKHDLYIKLFSVALCALLVFHEQLDYVVVALLLLCWLLEGIWKTFQHRMSVRILKIESAIATQQSVNAMQFHSDWLATRPGAVSLAVEYIKNCLTPTVMVPQSILLGVAMFVALYI